MADPKDVIQRDAYIIVQALMSLSGLNNRNQRPPSLVRRATCNSVTAIKRAANSRSGAPITVSAERSRKGGVTFYLWCTGRGIPLHASLFTGGLISGNRRGESNRENESKGRHKSFHRASPIRAVPERPSLRSQLTALPLRVSL